MSSSAGHIENFMNAQVFKPPIRLSKDIPEFIKTIDCTYSDCQDALITYFVIHPEPPKKTKKKYGKNNDPPYLVWNHGNACDIQEIYPKLHNMYNKMGRNIGIICYDYEGYGYSSGTPRETNCYRNLQTVVEYANKELGISRNKLFLVGHSLGTGIVIDYVHKHDSWETPIILLSPYKTISRVIYDPSVFNVGLNLTIKLVDRFCSVDKIGSIKVPIVIYHGTSDMLIECYNSLDLQKANSQYTMVVLIEGADHNSLFDRIDPRQIWNVVFNHINKNN